MTWLLLTIAAWLFLSLPLGVIFAHLIFGSRR